LLALAQRVVEIRASAPRLTRGRILGLNQAVLHVVAERIVAVVGQIVVAVVRHGGAARRRQAIVHIRRAVAHRARRGHVLQERIVDAHRAELVVHLPGISEGRAVAAAVVLRQRLQVVAGVVLRVGVGGRVPVGNLPRARERVPTVLRQQVVGPALADILHAVHGVVLVGDGIRARAAGSRRPGDLRLVAGSIVRHLHARIHELRRRAISFVSDNRRDKQENPNGLDNIEQ
jgi:hypothetical protein